MTIHNNDYSGLMSQVMGAAQAKFGYQIKPNYAEITYRSIDSELQMKIVSGLILCGFRHLDICAGNIRAYFDDVTSLVIHWN